MVKGDKALPDWKGVSTPCKYQMLPPAVPRHPWDSCPGATPWGTLLPSCQVQPSETSCSLPCLPEPCPRWLGAHSSLVGDLLGPITQAHLIGFPPADVQPLI